MANSVYQINKGINKSIEFKGLKAQYIWYMGIGIVLLLLVFTIMYFIGIPSFICVGAVLIAGTGLVIRLYAMSDKYGEHGMMKMVARRSIPKVVKCNSRRVFIDLFTK